MCRPRCNFGPCPSCGCLWKNPLERAALRLANSVESRHLRGMSTTTNGRANPKKTNGSKRQPPPRAATTASSSSKVDATRHGRRAPHNWRYDEGHWFERKLTPEKWRSILRRVKRRKGRAPEGFGRSGRHGVPLVHPGRSDARKLDANSYATEMVVHKYKLAHKRADKETWSASERAPAHGASENPTANDSTNSSARRSREPRAAQKASS
jgi:hypothetical protein